ncbi:accessory Sec system translocase SecA2 [Acetivibrio cellulolyticus]|uniref:accessory Sec system translocase SecA2 n=1 Tax=Acetivibrio cellulolyticus TaxID=35830 RepID=UPI0001E2D98B|nr:accessory Sec system translocase SecA2 [Acetivibrio cellulolyticus]
MFKKLLDLKKKYNMLKNDNIEYNVEKYYDALEKINGYKLELMEDEQLRSKSLELRVKLANGKSMDSIMPEAYALAREASARVLGMRHYDVQVIAGIAMNQGKLVEMQTGEGKTLAAVLPAYLNAIKGQGVHILTFNDYLAERDAGWMGPVFRFLGLSVGYIVEGMSINERKRAYDSDVTYVTAKEAGFDYLRSFLIINKDDIIQRPFNYAIVDEADSILIDEARIPLVIAGGVQENEISLKQINDLINELKRIVHYNTDEYKRNVFLTDEGMEYIESALGLQDLFDERNVGLITKINNALHAHVLLKCNVDYIIKNSKIELIDEFTGRIAENRRWPYGLQEAIEVKEGFLPESKGQIMASITLQNFIRLYPKISGMTGTALSAADELKEFYDLNVVLLPTNRENIRIDLPDIIFTHLEAKYKALIEEISKVHKTGRPILIGTSSVEESEYLALSLRDGGIECRVLNAKNDAMEAKIVSKAGSIGAVTVSTNMAGRGTDIKLGGENQEEREKVVELGGLYVIGTNRHESLRIDFQLRGRAGRQGDPGSTQFFISMEDSLMVKYNLSELIPKKHMPKTQIEPINNQALVKIIAHAQRIIEGQNFEIRKNLVKYSLLLEDQRRIIYNLRRDALFDLLQLQLFKTRLKELYNKLLPQVGEEALVKAEKQVTLYYINKSWAEYLDYISYLKESIHLVNVGNKQPIHEFNRTIIEAFDNFTNDLKDEITSTLKAVNISKEGIDMDKEGLKAPTSTWTYLINDSAEQVGILPLCSNAGVAALNFPLLLVYGIFNRFYAKVKR